MLQTKQKLSLNAPTSLLDRTLTGNQPAFTTFTVCTGSVFHVGGVTDTEPDYTDETNTLCTTTTD